MEHDRQVAHRCLEMALNGDEAAGRRLARLLDESLGAQADVSAPGAFEQQRAREARERLDESHDSCRVPVAAGPRVTEPQRYPYPSTASTQVPDRTDTGLMAELRREGEAQLANPAGSSVYVVNLEVGHGDLVNDPEAQQQIGDTAAAFPTKIRGE